MYWDTLLVPLEKDDERGASLQPLNVDLLADLPARGSGMLSLRIWGQKTARLLT